MKPYHQKVTCLKSLVKNGFKIYLIIYLQRLNVFNPFELNNLLQCDISRLCYIISHLSIGIHISPYLQLSSLSAIWDFKWD